MDFFAPVAKYITSIMYCTGISKNMPLFVYFPADFAPQALIFIHTLNIKFSRHEI